MVGKMKKIFDNRNANLQPPPALRNHFSRQKTFLQIIHMMKKFKKNAQIIANIVIFFAIICILSKSMVYSLVAKQSAT